MPNVMGQVGIIYDSYSFTILNQLCPQVLENSVLSALATLVKILLLPVQLLAHLAQHMQRVAD